MSKTIKIGNRAIGEGCKVFIIAEAGINHQGDIQIAKKLIDIAVEAGCDCVKFQKRDLQSLYPDTILRDVERQQQDIQYALSNLKKVELSESEMICLMEYCTEQGIEFLCTPWDEASLRFLARLNLPAYKVASADMFNHDLIRSIVRLNKPLIVSTGMSYMSEIDALITFLNALDASYAILHCNSTYPAPYYDINLNFLKTLKERGVDIIGYSSHEMGTSVCLAAVALGAKVIEKHITLDKSMEGQDHRASATKEEIKELVKQIRLVETALGDCVRYPSRGEYMNREVSSKSLVAARNLKKGEILCKSDLTLKSPGMGVNPLKRDFFIGKKLIRDICKDTFLSESDIFTQSLITQDTGINHKWGLVARMADVQIFLQHKPDFVEIHPTGADITREINNTERYDVDITVHAPEYNKEMLIDLSSIDERIRKDSVLFLKKSIDYFQKIKKLFKNKNDKVMYVLHPGGMNMTAPQLDKIDVLNTNLLESVNILQEYAGDEFELLIENHPPYPWYFGGQWNHASFMDADEIARFARETGYGIVYDISHAALYCNAYQKNLEEYTKTILKVTKFIHIADAAGVSGEGIQIGEGTIDFKKILKLINKKDVWVLSEIWQGHKFEGEGFIKAVKKLKEIDGDF